MIIDIHTHPHRRIAHADAETRAKGKSLPPPLEVSDILLERAGRLGIERICLLGSFTAHPDEQAVRAINDVTIAMVQRHPGRVFGLAFLNPRLDPAFLVEEIDRCVEQGLSGVKHEFEALASDPMLDPIMQRIVHHDVFLLHHAWNKTVGRCSQESGSAEIAALARRHPQARIVMAHLTGVGIKGVLDVKHCENVWVDTSGHQPVAGLVEYAVAQLGAERVVFGSDVPVRDFATQLGRIEGADLSAAQRKRVLGLNAAELLKINGRGT